MDMLELLNEEEKVLELIQNMPEVQQVVTEREKQSCKCTELASKFCVCFAPDNTNIVYKN
jgi:predicted RNase H-like nuclease (RuvC/YqgF family)